MSISRRKFIRAASTFAIGFTAMFKAKGVKPASHNDLLGYKLHDDVCVSLLNTYARSLALDDERARWQAQMMFHEAQLAREGGGTMGHKLGYKHEAFVAQREGKVLTSSQTLALTFTR